jgi:hypothetical protein
MGKTWGVTDSTNTQSSDERIQWERSLALWGAKREVPLQARTFRRGWRTKAEPVLMSCEDGNVYVVKGRQAGRQIVNDHIVACLGQALGAPVGQPRLIHIPAELVAIERNLAHIPSGTAHGTLFIPGCIDQWDLIATSEIDNRSRLALLAVLYGWVTSNDWQFLFRNDPPRLIYSVDHGHFFPGGPEWTVESLLQAPIAVLDLRFAECDFTGNEIRQALSALEEITEETIVQAVARPPDSWGLTMGERVALVEYFVKRRQELLQIL